MRSPAGRQQYITRHASALLRYTGTTRQSAVQLQKLLSKWQLQKPLRCVPVQVGSFCLGSSAHNLYI
jgi:hypothetical protein